MKRSFQKVPIRVLQGFSKLPGDRKPAYAALKADSQWCKTQINIGATRSEMIEQYERCMKDKGYRLEGSQGEVDVKESTTKTVEQRFLLTKWRRML